MSLTLNFLGGAPFQLLYDGVRVAIGKTSKFKILLVNLETTLNCLQPRIIQQIRDRNVALNLPNEIIQDLQVKMGEGIELVAKLSRLSMWNIRVWGNCCNCIKPNYADQLDELDRSLRRLLEILKLEQMRNVTELLDVARRTFDKLDEVQRGQSEILRALQEIPAEILKTQQEIIQRIEGYGVQHVANGGGGAARARALGIAFQALFDVVIRVKVKNVVFKRLLGEFKYTIDCLKPLIEEIAASDKLLHVPKQDVENYIIEMEKGVELVQKCCKALKWASYKKYKTTKQLLRLDESLQRLFIDLKGQVERNVKEAMDLTSNIEAVIKQIGGGGVVQNYDIERESWSPLHQVLKPRSPTVGLDVLNMQGARDMIEETLIDVGVVGTEGTRLVDDSTHNVQGTMDVKETCDLTWNIEGIEVKRSEGSGVVQNQTEIAVVETEPPSATVRLDILDVKGTRDVMETLDANVGVGVKQIEESVAPNQSEVAVAEPSSLTAGMSMQDLRRDVETMDFRRDMEVVKTKGEMEQEKEENEDKVSVESFPRQSCFEVGVSKDMEEGLDDAGQAEKDPPNAPWWPSDFEERFQLVSLGSKKETLRNMESPKSLDQDVYSSLNASQVLWRSGVLVEPIPDGFYFVIPEKRLKQRFDEIPTLDELHALEAEGLQADIILVDSAKDKKLAMLKQLIRALIRGLNSNAAEMIKKIVGLVSDYCKWPAKAISAPKDRGLQLLGNIRHGSCFSRAILFKVLADTVGLESRLMVDLPSDGTVECVDSCSKHISVIVLLNSVELLVDLSSKAVPMAHNYASGESDSAEYNSCCSPLELNYSQSSEYSTDNNDSLQLRMIFDAASNIPHDELIAELWTASPSPENASVQGARRLSLLGGGRKSSYSSHGASKTLEGAQRLRHRKASETADDSVGALRAVTQQSRILKGHVDERSFSHPSDDRNIISPVVKKNDQITSQKVVGGRSDFIQNDELVSTWNKILKSATSDKGSALFPYQDWNIDFSDLSVGNCIGVGFYGEVFRGIWNGTDVAIKVFLEQDLTAENMADFCNEISILSRIRHPNVILFLGACTKPPRLSMVTEYMDMGSLYYLIHLSGQKKKLFWRRKLRMLKDICRGLMCIHRMKVVHCNLKSANCLVNKYWTVKICDFGLSRMMFDTNMKDSSSAGDPEWMAPELIRKEPFTEKCDIFSFGVIMWELCTLNRPWEGVPPERVINAIANEGSRLEIPDNQLGGLISDCWTEQPHLRPTCGEILERLIDCDSLF